MFKIGDRVVVHADAFGAHVGQRGTVYRIIPANVDLIFVETDDPSVGRIVVEEDEIDHE